MGPAGTSSMGANGQLQPQQKRIINKVWSTVEKVMGRMKNVLVLQLQEPMRTVEEQTKTIE